jgi:HAD superfamily phosphoserine phosphatase-like hydrolase
MNIKMIAFDIEGTLTVDTTWQTLNAIAGISREQDATWYEEYYQQRITHKEWSERLITRYRCANLPYASYVDAVSQIHIKPGVKELLSILKRTYRIVLVSSAIDYYVHLVAEALEVHDWNTPYQFILDSNGTVRSITMNSAEDEAKVTALKIYSEKYHILPDEMLYVGDSLNDRKAFEYTGNGIFVGSSEKNVMKAAQIVISDIQQLPSVIQQLTKNPGA